MDQNGLDAVLTRLRGTVRTKGVERLKEFIRLPSISNEAGHQEGIEQAAMFVETWLERIGFEVSRVVIDGHNPIICARYTGSGENRKTVGFYGHYDVQPTGKGWTMTGAFEPIVRTVLDDDDLVVVGRGSGDMKGPLCAFLMALEAIWEEHGEYPDDFALAIEGEEEAGSDGFVRWLQQPAGKDYFRNVEAILVPDVHAGRDVAPGILAAPSVAGGLRGLAYLLIRVFGTSDACHSGTYSGNVQCALEALNRIIASFRKPDSSEFAIAGFNEAVVPLTPAERAVIDQFPVDEAAMLALTGAPALIKLPEGRSRHEQQGAFPSLTVHGMSGGDTDPESTPTSIYPIAWAKVSFRLAYGQDAAAMFLLIKAHVDQFVATVLEGTVKVEVIDKKLGEAARVDVTTGPVALAAEAMSQAWGTPAFVELDGGSIPLVRLIQNATGVPVVLWGGTDKRSRFHGPDEFVSVDNFAKSSEGMARWIYAVAAAA